MQAWRPAPAKILLYPRFTKTHFTQGPNYPNSTAVHSFFQRQYRIVGGCECGDETECVVNAWWKSGHSWPRPMLENLAKRASAR